MKHIQRAELPNVKALAEEVAQQLLGGEVLALIGELGSGKTTFTKHLAKYLKIKHTVTSPTFVVMNMFPGKLRPGKKITLYHLDLYRTKNFREVSALGIEEFWGKKGTVTVIEWADKIKKRLPKNTYYIYFI
jgi:tRNA threonylcarbamoyladenosine biosynthesis protein TsaE